MPYALIGAGRIGRLHARNLAGLVGGDQLLIADADSARAAAVAAEVGAIAVPVAEALSRARAIVIATGTDAHAELMLAAAARRSAIFCEKPIALDLATSARVVAAVEAAGVPTQLGFQRRFDPGYREARRMVESGELGTVYCVRLSSHDPAPPHESFIPSSGGLFRDFSIHDFDAARWLLGSDVDEVYADGGVRGFEMFATYGDIDTGVATLRMANGALGVVTTTRHDPRGYDVRAELFGSRDSIAVGMDARMPLRSVEPGVPPPAQPGWDSFAGRFEAAYRAELAEFVRVAAGEVPSTCTARDALEALRVAEAATRSLGTHRPIPVSSVDVEPAEY